MTPTIIKRSLLRRNIVKYIFISPTKERDISVAMTRTLSEIGSNIFPNLLSQEYFLARYPSKKSDIPARKKKKRVN